MTEYIERKALRDTLYDADAITMSGVKILNQFPGADVAPVRHGRWIKYQIPPIICCSNCDWATDVVEKNFQYCPMCGTQMDGGDGDAAD